MDEAVVSQRGRDLRWLQAFSKRMLYECASFGPIDANFVTEETKQLL